MLTSLGLHVRFFLGGGNTFGISITFTIGNPCLGGKLLENNIRRGFGALKGLGI